jgi:sigma-E factor negative regulatory protein RseC
VCQGSGAEAACFGCPGGECKKNPSPVTAENRNRLYLEPGLLVETGIPAITLFREISTAILPPLLGFAAGYFLAGLLPSASDASCAAGGLLLFFVSAAAACLVRRRHPAKTRLEIRRVIAF